MQILIITDNQEAADMLAHGLTLRGMQVDVTGIDSHLRQGDDLNRYTLILVDTDRTDGVVLCRQVRTEYVNPLLLMTYERDERYHLTVYSAGVDECITKPIGNSLFLAKVDVWLRRVHAQRSQGREINVASFHLDTVRRRLKTPAGEEVRLTALENRLAILFFYNPGQVLENELIISRVWNDYSVGDNTLLKNLVYRIRRKIEPVPNEPQYIQTVMGGYVFWPGGSEPLRQINSYGAG
jgi:DNA-binding response OmpR family regulator